LLEKHISAELENVINGRSALSASRNESTFVPILKDDAEGLYNHELIAPIISEGDVLGAVVFLSPDQKMGELESKLAHTAAGFLGRQMEQ
jgi:AbrB family transcriptional regulator (stage V sporulation protein T)